MSEHASVQDSEHTGVHGGGLHGVGSGGMTSLTLSDRHLRAIKKGGYN